MTRFVLLDRDGTLTRDAGYTYRIEDYALLPGVPEGLIQLREAGFRFAIVTNQSGIGRGYFTRSDFDAFQRHLRQDLARRGIEIAASFVCPHRPDEGCACRKPAPGLLFQARDALGADLGRSFMLGDSVRDVVAGRRAGCAGSLWIGAEPAPDELPVDAPRVPDLPAAAAHILAAQGQGAP